MLYKSFICYHDFSFYIFVLYFLVQNIELDAKWVNALPKYYNNNTL